MKFKCRPSKEEREKIKFESEKEWHRIFLWWPKRMEDGNCYWLCHIEGRRCKKIVDYIFMFYISAPGPCEIWPWEYRLISEDNS